MDVSNLTKNALVKMFAEGKRFDGRGLLDLNEIVVEHGVSNKAEGSARVKMGKTEVIVGVKMEIGTPYPDSLDCGNLMVSGDLLPLASPRFEPGPPKFNAIELPRLLDRLLRESGFLDLSKYCIKEGEKVWTIIVDVYPINDDGSLIDAAAIGCVAAIKNAVFPGIDENDRPDYSKRTKNKLPVEEIVPVSLTFYKLGDSILLHPTREEEEACEAKLTLGISKVKGRYLINSAQKGLEFPLTKEDISKIMKVIPEKYEETLKKAGKFLK